MCTMSPSETLADLSQPKLKLFMICILSTIQEIIYSVSTCGYFPRGLCGQDINLTTHLHPMLRRRMSEAIPHLFCMPSWCAFAQI